MTVRPPRRLSNAADEDANPLAAEILAEKAAGLGRSGRLVEERLEALAASPPGEAERPERLRAAVEAVYYFLIQRELCGLRDHRPVVEHYRIPSEVLARLGAV
jgi:hypothetical protein